MNFNDLTKVWETLESQNDFSRGAPFKLVCPESLHRIYLGCLGEPLRRAVLFEIPIEDARAIKNFSSPTGIQCFVKSSKNEKAGNTSCFLVSSTHENNSIFALVLSDILSQIIDKKTNTAYLKSLQQRIESWKEFFKNQPPQKLSREAEIGLFGELCFLKQLLEKGFTNAVSFWNGPLKAAQDFQFDNLAVEIKSNQGETSQVKISSEDQLDPGDLQLYLGLLNFQSGTDGSTLPELIEKVEEVMPGDSVEQFQAKLLCVGYLKQNAALYTDRFLGSKQQFFQVKDDFPRIFRSNLPKNISHVRYKLDLSACENYAITAENLFDSLRSPANGK
jgi:hypothetical protein